MLSPHKQAPSMFLAGCQCVATASLQYGKARTSRECRKWRPRAMSNAIR